MLETPTIATFLTTLAQAGDGGGGGGINWLIPVLFVAGFWFLIIAPQRKMQKQQDAMLAELKNGDEIMTKGGIFGTVTNIKADRIVMKIGENAKIELSKPFIQTVVKKKGEPEKTEEK